MLLSLAISLWDESKFLSKKYSKLLWTYEMKIEYIIESNPWLTQLDHLEGLGKCSNTSQISLPKDMMNHYWFIQ